MKYLLVKKMFTTSLPRKDSSHWLSGKEKVPGVAISKEGHAESIPENERT